MQQHDFRRAYGRQFIIPARAANHSGPIERRLQEGFRHQGNQLGPGHAHEQMTGPGRVDHGAQNIKERAHAQFLAQRADIPEGGMEMRREKKGEIAPSHHFGHRGRISVQGYAQGFQSVSAAAFGGHGPVAVLDHLVAHAGQHQRSGCGAVERIATVAARAHHVNADA